MNAGCWPFVKLEFHDADTDTDILARILADTSDARDFLKLFLYGKLNDTPTFSYIRVQA